MNVLKRTTWIELVFVMAMIAMIAVVAIDPLGGNYGHTDNSSMNMTTAYATSEDETTNATENEISFLVCCRGESWDKFCAPRQQ